jgi:hypothetical protein
MSTETEVADWVEYKHDDCPACGSRGWCQYSDTASGTMVMCMRPEGAAHPGFQRTKQTRDGADAHFVLLNGVGGYHAKSPSNGARNGPAPADLATRDAAYKALVRTIGLTPEHAADLVRRGLSGPDAASGRYGSIGVNSRHEVAVLVQSETGLADDEILAVPGFGKDDLDRLELTGPAGMIIPVTDKDGMISGCQIRPDKPLVEKNESGAEKVISKYLWLTSSKAGGPGAVASAHVPPVADISKTFDVVRLTEGPLKAHVATVKSDLHTIGIPGVGSYRLALPALQALGAKTVRLAYDADFLTNDVVASALARAARGLVAAGYELEAERWDPAQGKGIDDVLAAGGPVEVLSGLDAMRFALGASRDHGKAARVERDEVIAWVRRYLERDQAGDLFQDRELLAAAGELEGHDPAQHAALLSLLKKHNKQTTPTAFFKAAKHEARGTKKQTGGEIERFVERDGCTYSVISTKDGDLIEVMLADFIARIVREIMRHEGGESRLQFEIEGHHHTGITATVAVDSSKFAAMGWVEDLGSQFTVTAGRGTRDQLREAIQTLSHSGATVPRIDVYTSLGWEQIDGENVYLHAGGGIGAAGPVAVNVEPPSVLNKYLLPGPPADPQALGDAVAACLDILGLAKADRPGARGMAAVIAASPWRAVLGGPNPITTHSSGVHHSFKTSTAKIGQHHFCFKADDATMISTTWESSPKSLQRFTFDARDSLLVIDELTGERAIESATQVIQAQGNLRAGMRLTQSREYAAVYDPRGSILSTGEADPRRKSTLGRMLIVRHDKNTVDLQVLTQLQRHAAGGLFALAMSAFVQWLARPGQLAKMRLEWRRLADGIVEEHKAADSHMRHLGAAAEMAAAYWIFMMFAEEAGALAEVTANGIAETVEKYLLELAGDQKAAQVDSDPAERFLALLRAGLLSGRFHLRTVEDTDLAPDPYAEQCGWKKDFLWDGQFQSQRLEWQVPANSKQVGYLDGLAELVLLDPEMARTVARSMGREQGADFENVDKIARDLASAGASRTIAEGGRTRFQIRRTVRGARQCFIAIKSERLFESGGQDDTV